MRRGVASRSREGILPLLRAEDAASGVLCLVLGSPVQEGQEITGDGPAKGYEKGKRTGASLLWRKEEGSGSV